MENKDFSERVIGTTQQDVDDIRESKTPYQDTVSNTNLHRQISQDINVLVELFHGANREAGWWDKSKDQKEAEYVLEKHEQQLPDSARRILENLANSERDPITMQILIISEVIEALEGIRKDLKDDHLPHRSMEEVEMADVFLRLVDYCGGRKLDLGNAVCEKATYNILREDHKKENRDKLNGKRF